MVLTIRFINDFKIEERKRLEKNMRRVEKGYTTFKHATLKHGRLNTGQINTRKLKHTRQLNTKTQ